MTVYTRSPTSPTTTATAFDGTHGTVRVLKGSVSALRLSHPDYVEGADVLPPFAQVAPASFDFAPLRLS